VGFFAYASTYSGSRENPPKQNQSRRYAMNLAVGRKFPDIELPDQDGQAANLSELVGKFPFILTFYRGYW
jgi:cytochrome oxidase Cu insertion factor (SCO1/SenC/PrrC family)